MEYVPESRDCHKTVHHSPMLNRSSIGHPLTQKAENCIRANRGALRRDRNHLCAESALGSRAVAAQKGLTHVRTDKLRDPFLMTQKRDISYSIDD
jgi:hypothetical protein